MSAFIVCILDRNVSSTGRKSPKVGRGTGRALSAARTHLQFSDSGSRKYDLYQINGIRRWRNIVQSADSGKLK